MKRLSTSFLHNNTAQTFDGSCVNNSRRLSRAAISAIDGPTKLLCCVRTNIGFNKRSCLYYYYNVALLLAFAYLANRWKLVGTKHDLFTIKPNRGSCVVSSWI